MKTRGMIERALVLLLCSALAAPGCASTRATGVTVAPTAANGHTDQAVLAEYVQSLPLGSPIRLDLADGNSLRGTLMKTTNQNLVVQPRTRVPEPPVEIAFSNVVRVTVETPGGNNIAKAIGVGAAAGAGAALAVFFIIVAIYSD